MSQRDETVIEVDGQLIDLRNRPLAALLAWLFPGAGHYYQGRRSKAALYAVCILTLWIVGFSIGGSRVVYFSLQPNDRRWHYGFQVGAGAVALPAMLQARNLAGYNRVDPHSGVVFTAGDYQPMWNGFMAPPRRPVFDGRTDEVSAWYARYGAGYEMGTWYTMIAGLLNILVIYDACCGPLGIPISGRKRESEGADPATAGSAAGSRQAPAS